MRRSQHPVASERVLTRQELAELEALQAELARHVMCSDALVFVLGSYAPDQKDRLTALCADIEARLAGAVRARLMEQFIPDSDGDLGGHFKFRLVARASDAIVGIVEDDRGGFTYEQGVIVDNPPYFEKTFVLKRAYPPNVERRTYSWMQSTSLFAELERAGRLYEWHGDDPPEEVREQLLADLEAYIR